MVLKQGETYKNDRITISLLLCVAFIFCNFFNSFSAKEDELGNTSGNTINGGVMVKHKDKIYCLCKNGIMVMDVTGKNRKKVCSGSYAMLSSYGDYIYFSDGDNYLYKIKVGENKLIPISPKKSFYNFIIYNNWIYYTDKMIGNLYKTDIDCKKQYLISSGKYFEIAANKDWIYASNLIANKNEVYKQIVRISTNGKQKEKVGGMKSDVLYRQFFLNINENWIYFIDNNVNICKMSLDGTNKSVICKDSCRYVNVSNGWIYFSNASDGGKLYKIRVDGSDKMLLSDNESFYISVADDIVIFLDNAELKEYMIKSDGTGKSQL